MTGDSPCKKEHIYCFIILLVTKWYSLWDTRNTMMKWSTIYYHNMFPEISNPRIFWLKTTASAVLEIWAMLSGMTAMRSLKRRRNQQPKPALAWWGQCLVFLWNSLLRLLITRKWCDLSLNICSWTNFVEVQISYNFDLEPNNDHLILY